MHVPDDAAAGRSVLDALDGDACSYCENGTLVRDRYHGNAAVVCDECHTPGAQVW